MPGADRRKGEGMDEAERQTGEALELPESGGEQTPEARAEPLTSADSQGGQSGREREQREKAFVAGDLGNFMARYPEVDVRALDNDKAFRRFCGSRYAREPLADLYRDYLALAGNAMETARVREQSRTRRATGSGSSGVGTGLTAGEQRELDAWNKAFPSMKMTAKEFLER